MENNEKHEIETAVHEFSRRFQHPPGTAYLATIVDFLHSELKLTGRQAAMVLDRAVRNQPDLRNFPAAGHLRMAADILRSEAVARRAETKQSLKVVEDCECCGGGGLIWVLNPESGAQAIAACEECEMGRNQPHHVKCLSRARALGFTKVQRFIQRHGLVQTAPDGPGAA